MIRTDYVTAQRFADYIRQRPELRFWQALLAFFAEENENFEGEGVDSIQIRWMNGKAMDTFYREGL